ncbi:MAG: archaemetzincin family Zn-dependent metalloprotease [Candidatus Methanodesulfokora sp.]
MIIVPMKVINSELLSAISSEVRRIFGWNVIVESYMDAPLKYFNRSRRQYISEGILGIASRISSERRDVVLIVADLDAYADDLNFVFGQAELNGSAAVVYLERLKPEFYGKRSDYSLFTRRVLKEVMHELGHVMGLAHCGDWRCVMYFSNTIADTDRKGEYDSYYCSKCMGMLRKSRKVIR